MASIVRMTRNLLGLGRGEHHELRSSLFSPNFNFINYDKQAPLFGSVSRGTYCVHIFTAN